MCPHLSGSVLTCLRAHGITDVLDLLAANLEKVAQATSISYKVWFQLICVVISQTISWVSQVRLATVARISIFIE